MSFSADVKPNITPKAEPSFAGNGSEAAASQPLGKPVDEELTIALPPPATGAAAWAVKIPTFLYEKWSMVRQEGVLLGTMVVDSSTNPPTIKLRIPKNDAPPPQGSGSSASANGTNGTSGVNGAAKIEDNDKVKPEDLAAWSGYDTTYLPAEFVMQVPEQRSRNTYVFKEKKRDSVVVRDGALGKRKREKAFPTVTNQVAHECHLHPVYDETYERILRARRLENEVSRRPIQHLEDYASQGRINQLSSGHAAVRSSFGTGMASSTREPARSKDKLPRQDRAALRDRLFALFREKPYWNISVLKAELSQPDVWLREVLKDVAVQVKEGPYRDMWQLKEALRMLGPGAKAEDAKPDGLVKGEEGDEDDDEDEESDDEMAGADGDFDEDDFEEILA